MTDGDITQIIRAIAKLETKIEALEKRLEHGDHQFDIMDRRLDLLEQHNARILGGLGILVIIVPIAVRFFFP